jgi:hypothetical protein
MAEFDYDRARRKAFWRRIFAWIAGESNELLPFDDVREKLRIKGQHYLGLKQVPIEKIIGSSGRYRDFDRAFSPIQTRTRSRWLNIDKAHYDEVALPPVELYKMGEIYFVKDGNHRVSVARERGQEFIDAYVVEIVVPFILTEEVRLDELVLQQERSDFFEKTRLDVLRPDNQINTSLEGQYPELLEHIDVHRWYLGVQRKKEVSYEEAVLSWYDTVYLPLVNELRQQNLPGEFARTGETDLYLWVMKYVYYLRQTYTDEAAVDLIDGSSLQAVTEEAVKQAVDESPLPQLRKLASVVRKADWLVTVILSQERATFYQQTKLNDLVKDPALETSITGQYEKLLEHISVHRWYLGVQKGTEIPYEEAVISWYNNVYMPLVLMVREQDILSDFPGRTETDLYLWIISHQWYIRENLGEEISAEEAADQLVDNYPSKPV